MERKDININETWDLSQIYKSNELFYQDLDTAKELLNNLSQQKDTFLNTKENCLQFHDDYTYLLRIANKLYCFAHLNCDVEPNHQDYQTMNSAILTFFNEFSMKLDFYSNTMIDNDEKVKEYILDESFKEYRYTIEEVLREKEHILSQELETINVIVTGKYRCLHGFVYSFTNESGEIVFIYEKQDEISFIDLDIALSTV